MALIPCSECGNQVSDKAVSCPACGHPVNIASAPPPIPKEESKVTEKPKRGCSTVVLVILCGLIAISLITCVAAPSTEISSHNQDSSTQPTSFNAPARSAEQLLKDANSEVRSASSRLSSVKKLIREFPGTDEAKAAEAMINTLEEQARLESIGKQWRYSSREDAMSGKMTHEAQVSSSNTHEFDFPYNRPQHATLVIRDHARFGKDVLFKIERGQLQCSSYSGCTVQVRFGDSSPRTYSAVGPEDNSSEVIFFENEADFRRRMQSVNVVRISATVYQEGSPTWEFDVSGFKPERMK